METPDELLSCQTLAEMPRYWVMDKKTEMFIQLLMKDCEAWEQAAKWAEYIPVIGSADGLHWRSGKEEAAKFRARIAEHKGTIKQLQRA